MGKFVKPQTPRRARYRVTLRDGGHLWSFAFAAPDAHTVLQRLEELTNDPDAPLAGLAADSIRREVLRTLTDERAPVGVTDGGTLPARPTPGLLDGTHE